MHFSIFSSLSPLLYLCLTLCPFWCTWLSLSLSLVCVVCGVYTLHFIQLSRCYGPVAPSSAEDTAKRLKELQASPPRSQVPLEVQAEADYGETLLRLRMVEQAWGRLPPRILRPSWPHQGTRVMCPCYIFMSVSCAVCLCGIGRS